MGVSLGTSGGIRIVNIVANAEGIVRISGDVAPHAVERGLACSASLLFRAIYENKQ
jgi:hypothetical protein